ncbi:MAG: SUMF1/EgtB/PvdO family nonheme iron enzyme [Verrucomicrobiota bacterium JB023]|nr:SUMF1/EgtB/PvdO family nonheme iron enzyme [Verrucomicrobiota bacterium JB023]
MARRIRPTPEVPDLEILRQIGGGSYGEIWMARSVTGALRAVKIVYRDDFDDDRTFEREFEGILKYEPVARTHPGLVDVLHVGRGESSIGEDFYYYVMELGDDVERGSQIQPADYEARNLRGDMLRAGKRPLPVGFCIQVGARLASALAHLHEHGLAHRDMKPSNVIFRDGHACLADIGLVAARDQRTFVGTEGFVPPEGPGSTDADVYALGKVLYEMATGKDRLEFPELPDEPIPPKDQKRWLSLNKVICDVCEPRLSRRKIRSAAELAEILNLLKHSRKIRRKRQPVGLFILSSVVTATLVGLSFWPISSGKIAANPAAEDAAPTTCLLTVFSRPENADVYDSDGQYLGATPLARREYPLGVELTFRFELEGYQEHEETTFTDETEKYVSVSLTRRPPDPDIPWRDFRGEKYLPEPDYAHVSVSFVDPKDLRFFESARPGVKTNWETVQVTEFGQPSPAAFADRQTARAFVNWLAEESRKDGLSPERYRFRPVFSEKSQVEGVDDGIWEKGLRPFRVRVETIQDGYLYADTNPPGAFVFVNDIFVGITPLPDPCALLPGRAQVRFEREGYLTAEREVEIAEGAETRLPTVSLQETTGMPWQDPEWKNSLGMEFIRIDENLLAARWETRLADYAQFTRATQANALPRPEFPQNKNHPVVNITRTQAENFCNWLTRKEREEERIRESHLYRLPTNAEWSQLLGSNIHKRFPWGDDYPPQEKVANISGEEAAMDRPLKQLVPRYADGFVFTSPVGSFPPNALGIHDLGSNVREWTADDFSDNEAINYGVSRGASWKDYSEQHLESLFRRPVAPDSVNDAQGFRVVLVKEVIMPDNLPASLSDNG